MKKLGLILLTLVLAVACNSIPATESLELKTREGGCENDRWLDEMIKTLEAQSGQQSEIIRYQYNGQVVYWVEPCKGCADSMQSVYSCTGEVLCTFGGIAGFNTCPDFFEKATDRKVVWQN